MTSRDASCTVCHTTFTVKFSYQRQAGADGHVAHYCSQSCHERALFGQLHRSCSVCSTSFELCFAYQQAFVAGMQNYYCSLECRKQPVKAELRARRGRNSVRERRRLGP